jgi:hypothetical protein
MTQGRIMFGKIAAAAALLAMGSATAFATTLVAHVYVQTTKGVNLYNAAPNGQLTLASGSPFKTVGLMVGTNGKYFFSNGTNLVHVYAMSSTGTIGKEVANIDTSLYSGAECGTTGPTFLDHTGQMLYMEHYNFPSPTGDNTCYAVQSYKINSTTGQLTFLGATSGVLDRYELAPKGFTVTANNAFVYATFEEGYGSNYVDAFHRESGGAIDTWGFHETDSPPYDSSWGWLQFGVAADPANHLATIAVQEQDVPTGLYAPPQLASYTVGTQGNISTTNTWQNMATPVIYPTSLTMSPSGKVLAAAGNVKAPAYPGNNSAESPGLQVFHFNGASPITKFSGVLTSDFIDFIHWDNANHLYALSNSSGKLYVYTVTPTSITAVSGSPFKVPYISNPSSLAVR